MKKGKELFKRSGRDPYNLGNISDFLYERFAVSSCTECTGLIPGNPEFEQQRKSYREIYDIN